MVVAVFDEDEVGVLSPEEDFGLWCSGEWTLLGVVRLSTEDRPRRGEDRHSEGVFLLLPGKVGGSSFLDARLELVSEDAEWTLLAGLQDRTSLLSLVTRISSLLLLLLLLPELFLSEEEFLEVGFSAPMLLQIWTSRAKGLVLQSDWKKKRKLFRLNCYKPNII